MRFLIFLVFLAVLGIIFLFSKSKIDKSKGTIPWDKEKFKEEISTEKVLENDNHKENKKRKVTNDYRISKLLVLKAHYLGRKFLSNPNRGFAELMCLQAINTLENTPQTNEQKLRKLFYILILSEAERDLGRFHYRAKAKSFSENNGLTHIFSDHLKIIDATQTHKHVEGFSTNGYITDEGIKTQVNETVQIGFNIINICYDTAQRTIGFENLSYAEEEFLYHKTLPEIMTFHDISIPSRQVQYT